MRVAVGRLGSVVVLGVAVQHHHASGDDLYAYLTLLLFSFESWAGVPGPGESLLIAYGILAGKGHLEVGYVVLAAWGGATLGGIAGWIFGMHAGRRAIEAPGPLRRLRRSALVHGEEIYARFPGLAIVLAPSWISGIHHVRSATYLPWNAISSAMWAFGIGLAAYFVGPPVVRFIADEGLVVAGLFVLLVLVGVALTRRHRQLQSEAD